MNPVEQLLHGHVRDCREKIAAAIASVDALENMAKALGQRPAVAPGRIASWSEEEDELLRANFALIGPTGCGELLPLRTYGAIRARATKLELLFADNMKRHWCEQCQHKVMSGQVAACQSKFCTAKALVAAG